MNELRSLFGDRLQENVPLAHFTTARVGGPADALLPVHSTEELAEAAAHLWELGIQPVLVGGGSNVLVSDRGIRGFVLLNQARNTRIDTHHETPTVWAESGANLGALARQLALRGLSGLEWAALIPGTVGGAIYGNAGAFGGDVAGSLVVAEILHPESGRQSWTAEQLGYQYRSSKLKRERSQAIILAGRFQLQPSTAQAVQEKIAGFSEQRRRTQPPGANMGSMFKNPANDYAGRLIEAAGLKGHIVGDAEISSIHANFFINRGSAAAADVLALIRTAQKAVAERFGVSLELEIELVGEWQEANLNGKGEQQ